MRAVQFGNVTPEQLVYLIGDLYVEHQLMVAHIEQLAQQIQALKESEPEQAQVQTQAQAQANGHPASNNAEPEAVQPELPVPFGRRLRPSGGPANT